MASLSAAATYIINNNHFHHWRYFKCLRREGAIEQIHAKQTHEERKPSTSHFIICLHLTRF